MKQHPVWNALSHASIIGSVMLIIFFFIDRVNPAMDFLGSNLSKWCLFLYCIVSLFTALCSAVYLFKRGKSAGKRPHPQDRHAAGAYAEREPSAEQRRQLTPSDSLRCAASERDARYAVIPRGRDTLHDARYENERYSR